MQAQLVGETGQSFSTICVIIIKKRVCLRAQSKFVCTSLSKQREVRASSVSLRRVCFHQRKCQRNGPVIDQRRLLGTQTRGLLSRQHRFLLSDVFQAGDTRSQCATSTATTPATLKAFILYQCHSRTLPALTMHLLSSFLVHPRIEPTHLCRGCLQVSGLCGDLRPKHQEHGEESFLHPEGCQVGLSGNISLCCRPVFHPVTTTGVCFQQPNATQGICFERDVGAPTGRVTRDT